MGQGMKINGSAWPSNCCGFPSITLSLWKLVKLKKKIVTNFIQLLVCLFGWLFCWFSFAFFSHQTRSKPGCCCCCCCFSTLICYFILSSACLSNCTCPFVNTQVPAQWRCLSWCRHYFNFPFLIPVSFLPPLPTLLFPMYVHEHLFMSAVLIEDSWGQLHILEEC